MVMYVVLFGPHSDLVRSEILVSFPSVCKGLRPREWRDLCPRHAVGVELEPEPRWVP